MDQRQPGKKSNQPAASVSAQPTTQAASASDRESKWSWVESVVWTPRMLEALERGVKGGKWFTLIDKVGSVKVLHRAFELVKKNHGAAGVDRQSIAMFEKQLEHHLAGLAEQLRSGSYRPLPVKRVYIPKSSGEQRPLGIPAVRDRVVQAAMRMTLEPIFEHGFADTSFGFRPRRSAHGAIQRLEELLASGHVHIVDVDLKSYFDTIPHDALMAQIEQKIADGKVLALLRSFLTAGVLEDGVVTWNPTGSPQGAVISPLLANLYLDPLDHLLRAQGYEAIRYADDMVIVCREAAQAHSALTLLQQWTASAGLTLHPEKTRIVNATEAAFEFLGYCFDPRWRIPRRTSLQKFKDKVRSLTKRAHGHNLDFTMRRLLAPVIRGWGSYFRFCSEWCFERLDQWIRMRLRSILRKRAGLRGHGRGADHQKWPNAWFAEHGLLSLVAVRARFLQSAPRNTH